LAYFAVPAGLRVHPEIMSALGCVDPFGQDQRNRVARNSLVSAHESARCGMINNTAAGEAEKIGGLISVGQA